MTRTVSIYQCPNHDHIPVTRPPSTLTHYPYHSWHAAPVHPITLTLTVAKECDPSPGQRDPSAWAAGPRRLGSGTPPLGQRDPSAWAAGRLRLGSGTPPLWQRDPSAWPGQRDPSVWAAG